MPCKAVCSALSIYNRLSRCFLLFLFLARPPSTPWNIRAFNTSETSLVVDWSNFPGGLQVNFFILSANQTRPVNYYNYNKGIFRTVDSSLTSTSLNNLPIFSEHVVIVYLVDAYGEVYKSKQVTVETDEGGKFCVLDFCRNVTVVGSNYMFHLKQIKVDFFPGENDCILLLSTPVFNSKSFKSFKAMAMTMTGNLTLFKTGIFHLKMNLPVKKNLFQW